MSSEPSMEEILSSIKRIIAEEGDTTPGRPRRPMRAPILQSVRDEPEEVLELRDAIAPPESVRAVEAAPEPVPQPQPQPPEPSPAAAAPQDPIVSRQTADATRDALGNLSKLLIKPDANSDGTLEGLVRDMLRPMLRDWLDTNLPAIVEQMVAQEIAKITGGTR